MGGMAIDKFQSLGCWPPLDSSPIFSVRFENEGISFGRQVIDMEPCLRGFRSGLFAELGGSCLEGRGRVNAHHRLGASGLEEVMEATSNLVSAFRWSSPFPEVCSFGEGGSSLAHAGGERV